MQTRRIAELDGLRGIAAVGVALYHIHPMGTFWLWSFVDLFFVLSGFLITGILLRLDDWTWPNLRNFWIRRILRIWPVYYLTLAAVLLLWFVWSLKHGQPLRPFAGFWESTVFLHYLVGDYASLPPGVNYLWWFGHSWSLAVEEQFYLVWPLVLWRLRRNPLACLAALFCLLGVIVGFRALHPAVPDYLLLTRGDGLILGSLVAVLQHLPRLGSTMQERRFAFQALSVALLGAGVLLVAPYLIDGYTFLRKHVATSDPHLSLRFALLYAVVVWTVSSDLLPTLNRVLRTRLLVYLGALSYAIYMFHLPIQKLLDQLYNSKAIGSRLLVELTFWVLVLGAAALSHRFFEARFERLKSRFPLPAGERATPAAAAPSRV